MLEQLGKSVLDPHHVGTALGGTLKLGLRIVEHTCTQAHASVVALKDVIVDTSLASGPELLIVGEFRKCYRAVAHLRVQLHHGKRSGDGEDLREGKSQSCKLECLCLYTRSQPQSSELRIDNEARSGHIITMFPTLYVTEPDQTVVTESNYSLTALYLLGDVLRRAPGYAGAALQGRFIDEVDNLLSILAVFFLSKHHLYLVIVHLTVAVLRNCLFIY